MIVSPALVLLILKFIIYPEAVHILLNTNIKLLILTRLVYSWEMVTVSYYKIWCSASSVNEDSGLIGCYEVSIGKQLTKISKVYNTFNR
jgi:hypothetical protein